MCDGGIGVYVFVLTGRKSTSDDVVVLIPDKVQRLGLGVNNISSSKNTAPERNEKRRVWSQLHATIIVILCNLLSRCDDLFL